MHGMPYKDAKKKKNKGQFLYIVGRDDQINTTITIFLLPTALIQDIYTNPNDYIELKKASIQPT